MEREHDATSQQTTSQVGASNTSGVAAHSKANALRGLEFTEQEKFLATQSDVAAKIKAVLRASNVEDSRFGRALRALEGVAAAQRLSVLRAMRDRDPAPIDDLLENTPPSQQRAQPRGWLSLLTTFQETTRIVSVLYRGIGAFGIDPAQARVELTMALESLSQTELTRFAALEPELWTQWLIALDDERWARVATSEQARGYASPHAESSSSEERPLAEQPKVAERDLKKKLETVEDLLSYGAFDWAITDKEATKAFRLIEGLGDPDAIAAIVTRLDARGAFVDRLLDNTPPNVRWNNKKAFLGIAAARDPKKSLRFVKDILDPGFLGGVSDEEARLVFNLVQRLPERERERFRHLDDGKWWARMCEELAIEDKAATDANFFEDEGAMQKLLADLDANLMRWSKVRVDNAVAMLVAEHKLEELERLFQARGLDQDGEYDWLYTKYGFARSGGERDPRLHARFKEKSTGQAIGDAFQQVGAGLSVAGQVLSGEVEDPRMNVDLEDVQTAMGGEIGGVELARRGRDESEAQTNRLVVRGERKAGRVEGEMAKLVLKRMAILSGQSKLSSGPVTVEGVRFQVKFGSPEDRETWFRLQVSAIEASDLMRTTDRSMQRLGRAKLSDLAVAAEAPKSFEHSKLPLVALYSNAFETVRALLGEVPEQFAHLIATMDLQKPDPAFVAAGLSQAFSGLAGASVRLGALVLDGLGLGAEGFVEGASIEGLSLDLRSRQKGVIARQKIATLEGIGRTPTQEQELVSLREELALIVPLEERLAELETAKKRGPLSMHEEAQRRRLATELTVTSTDLTVDALRVRGVDMGTFTLTSGDVTELDASIAGQTRGSGTPSNAPGARVSAAAGIAVSGLEVHDAKAKADPKRGVKNSMIFGIEQGRIDRLEATLDEQGQTALRAKDASVEGLSKKDVSAEEGPVKTDVSSEGPVHNNDLSIASGSVDELSARGTFDWAALAAQKEKGEALDMVGSFDGRAEVEGVRFHKFRKGKEGEEGVVSADNGRLDRATIRHSRAASGRTTTTASDVEGLRLNDLKVLQASKLDALKMQRETIKKAFARARSPQEAAKLRRKMKEVERMLAEHARAELAVGRARNEKQRDAAVEVLKTWTDKALMTIATIEADLNSVSFTQDESGRFDASAEIDRLTATTIVAGDTKVGAVRLEDASARARGGSKDGEMVLDELDARAAQASVHDAKTKGAGVRRANAKDASVTMGDGTTAVGARSVSASGVHAGGNSVGWVGATQAKATISERGVSGRAGTVRAHDARVKGADHEATVSRLDARQVDFAARGNRVSANARSVDGAGVKAKLMGSLDKDTGQRNQTQIDADRIEARGLELAAGDGLRVGAKRIAGYGLAAKFDEKERSASGSAQHAVIDDARVRLGQDGAIDASVGAAVVTRAEASGRTHDGQTFAKGSVDELGIHRGRFGKSADGAMSAGAGEASIVGARGELSQGATHYEGGVERVHVRGADAVVGKSGHLAASVEEARVEGLDAQHRDRDAGTLDALTSHAVVGEHLSLRKDTRGVVAEAGWLEADGRLVRESKDGIVEARGAIDVVDAGVELGPDDALRAEFGEVRGDRIVFKDTANRVDVLLDFFRVGDRDGGRSSVAMKPSGQGKMLVDANIKTIEVGNGYVELGDHHVETDAIKGRLVAKDFDPSDLARAGSTLAIRDFHGKKFAWDQYHSTAFVDGVDLEHFKADSLWLRGLGPDADKGEGRFAAGVHGLVVGEGRVDMTKAQPSFRGYTVDDAGAVFTVGADAGVVAAWADGVDLEHTQVSAQLVDPEEGTRREAARDNKAFVEAVSAMIDRRRVIGVGPSGSDWEDAVTSPTQGEFREGDSDKYIKSDVLDHVNGHVSVVTPDIWTAGLRAQVEIPVRNGRIKLTDIRAHLGPLPLAWDDTAVSALDLFDRMVAGTELIEDGYIPMSKFITLMNASNGSHSGYVSGKPLIDADTGPSHFTQRIEVTAHVSNLKGTTTLGTMASGRGTEVVLDGGSMSAQGTMNHMRLGAKDMDIRSIDHAPGDVRVREAGIEELHMTARDLGDPDKRIGAVIKGATIKEVIYGKRDHVEAGRAASKDDRETHVPGRALASRRAKPSSPREHGANSPQ